MWEKNNKTDLSGQSTKHNGSWLVIQWQACVTANKKQGGRQKYQKTKTTSAASWLSSSFLYLFLLILFSSQHFPNKLVDCCHQLLCLVIPSSVRITRICSTVQCIQLALVGVTNNVTRATAHLISQVCDPRSQYCNTNICWKCQAWWWQKTKSFVAGGTGTQHKVGAMIKTVSYRPKQLCDECYAGNWWTQYTPAEFNWA